MRSLALIPLALLTAACWTRGPGQLDPSRYPWDPANLNAKATYCIIAVDQPDGSGISTGGNAAIVARGQVPTFGQVPPSAGSTVELACTPPPGTV